MFILQDFIGNTITQKDGSAFTYSARWLAKIGKKVLENERKIRLRIVEN